MRRLAIALLVVGLLGGCSLGDDEGRPPQIGVEAQDGQGAETLGFPADATRNTIRVGGSRRGRGRRRRRERPVPGHDRLDRPTAVVLVDSEDWQTAIAASVLAGPPIGAPLLLSEGDELRR